MSASLLFETQRLRLRQFTVADIDALVELDSDPAVMRFISNGQPTPRERFEREVIPRWLAFYPQVPPRGFWAVELRATGTFCGWFHLRPDRLEPAAMELGYRLKRSAWGCGLATEGSRALLARAFGEWAYARVTARTLVGNLASRRVMEKSGLRYEGDFVYAPEVLPGWSEAERRAVTYGARREEYPQPAESPVSRV